MRKSISPHDLAKAIGVSESSLKRWADAGKLHVHRTVGGHRRIPMAEALRFVRATRSQVVEPELLGLNQLTAISADMPARADEANRLFQCLRQGNGREARGLILAMYVSGRSAAEIFDGPLRIALSHLGELWRHSPEGIFIEHRATDICIQAMSELRMMIEVPANAPVAVGCAPQGDPYLLPTMMAAITLLDSGWNAVNLGPDTPIDSLEQAARKHHAQLVWISVSVFDLSQAVMEQIRTLPQRLGPTNQRHGARVVVGGAALGQLNLDKNSDLLVGASMQALAELAGTPS
jgi:excisionase family DNA binding protein